MLRSVIILLVTSSVYACRPSSSSSNPAPAPAPSDASAAATPAANAAKATAFNLVGSTTGIVNTCAGVDIQVQDETGAPFVLNAPESAALKSSSASAVFYSDAACTTVATSVNFSQGSSDANIYLKDTASGAQSIAVNDSGSLGLPAAALTFTLTSSTLLAFTSATLSQSAATCGSLAIEVQSSPGAAQVQTAAVTLALASSSATGAFYSDSACTQMTSQAQIAAGSADAAAVYYKDLTAGSPTLTVSENPSQGWTKASMTATVTN
ncbi:MAG: hypothetical protein NTZ90_09730 [Proteobacteria bacterium]|nr:hypothetical protein [Pseudomonadota bacterium]